MSLDTTAVLTLGGRTVAEVLVSESRSITHEMFDSVAATYPDAVARDDRGSPLTASLTTGQAHAMLQKWRREGTFGYEASALAFAIDRLIETVQAGATMDLVTH